MKIDHEVWDAAAKRADEHMKQKNGHTYEHILKTRCIYCGRSPKQTGKCSGWFMTFMTIFKHELEA